MVACHDVITCHIQTNLQTGFFGQLNSPENHIVFLYQITLYKQISISLEHLQRQFFRFQRRRCSQICAERALSVRRYKSRRHSRRQCIRNQQVGFRSMLQQTFPKKVTIRIIIYLSDEPGSRSKLRHATDCISGRATGSQMSFHTAKFFIDFQ